MQSFEKENSILINLISMYKSLFIEDRERKNLIYMKNI